MCLSRGVKKVTFKETPAFGLASSGLISSLKKPVIFLDSYEEE
jgi:hypothetical protein